ncbi:MAG TPA: sulfatase-like hydrolase/transferase [Quisquiliibacterium sp.]|nr:sulfatase-like hydrolase/transferase [Quisquiliibacterium sp.]
MTAFDPFATRAVRRAENLEPAFVHAEQVALAQRKLDDYVARRGRRPNILVFLMDDVGWGDFGCYGGGVAVGAPTPNFDRLAAQGLRLTSCYSEPTCSPSRATLMTGRVPHRHGLHRPPMYGEPGGLAGEITLPQLLSDAGYVTQAVGKWHIGENLPSQPQNVGFDDFYGFLSVSDMYTEWRDPHYFPEIVYSAARSDWIRNMPFNKCFVHATRGKEAVNVEEVTIPVLSQLDDKWCTYSSDFIRARAGKPEPWLLYHNTRGAHFDNYPHEKFLASSPARHPYKDTLVELDDVMRRLVQVLRDTGQAEDTLIFVSSDNGPHMETWPDAAFTPFRCSKGSTWEGGVRVPGLLVWPGMIEAGQASDGLFNFCDVLPTALALAGASERLPTDRYIDGVDQTSFLLTPDGDSNRKYHHYWLLKNYSAIRCGEYKMMLRSTSDEDSGAAGPGGFTGVLQEHTYPKLYNLYLDPKESHNYLTRKLSYMEAFQLGIRQHLGTFRKFPPKTTMGLAAADPREG